MTTDPKVPRIGEACPSPCPGCDKESSEAPPIDAALKWRAGSKLGRTIYQGQNFEGLLESRHLADRVVALLNADFLRATAPTGEALPRTALLRGRLHAHVWPVGVLQRHVGRRPDRPPQRAPKGWRGTIRSDEGATVNEYVVRNRYGGYWNGKRWDSCLRCAQRASRDEAHKQAHKDNGEGWTVIRVRPKAAPVVVELSDKVKDEHYEAGWADAVRSLSAHAHARAEESEGDPRG